VIPYDPTYAYGGLPPGAVPYPPPGYPVQQAYGQPPTPPRQAAPPVRTAQVPAPKAPAIRAQAPDDIKPQVRTTVAMPSPDQLGVAARPADGSCDWAAARQRMQDLGVVTFQVDHPAAEQYQFTCLLRTAEAGRTHRIEAQGATESEAVRRALDEAQRWRAQ